ncbi:MAG: hypothetical protein AB8H86_18070 [Polyangiales bacterium]
MIRAFLVASVLTACGGTVCQPDRCGSGRVCGLSGTCEPAPAGDEEELVIVDEDAELPIAYEVSSLVWGTSDGEQADEVPLGGESGATLYLAFRLHPEEVATAVLELQPSEDTTYGAPQTLEVWDVTAFESIDVRRLPGARFERHARRSVWQSRFRVDVSAMAQAADEVVYLAVRARGDSPGWRIATPGAGNPLLRPRLVVHGESAETIAQPAIAPREVVPGGATSTESRSRVVPSR